MSRYYFDGEEHWLADRRGPATLVLSDGSVWEVADLDRAILANWIRFSSIEVLEVDGMRSVYILANKSFGTQVTAKFLGVRELDAA